MRLNILEKFLLIAHHPIKSKFIIPKTILNCAIIGALVSDMIQSNQLKISNGKLISLKENDISDPIRSRIDEIIRESKRQKKTKYWISKLSREANTFKSLTLKKLSKHNIFRIDKGSFLAVFSFEKSYLTDEAIRIKTITNLKDKLFSNIELSNEDKLLLGLIETCNMIEVLSENKTELKALKIKLKDLQSDNSIATAVDDTFKQMQLIINSAIVSSAVVASSVNR